MKKLLALLLLSSAVFAQTVGSGGLVSNQLSSSGSGVSGLTAGRVTLSTGATSVGDDAGLAYDAGTDTLTVAGACVVPTLSPAADVLSQKRGTNAQTFRIYNTDDGAGNAEWMSLAWTSNTVMLDTQASGTGALRQLKLVSGANIMRLGTNGLFVWDITGGDLSPTSSLYTLGANTAIGGISLDYTNTATVGAITMNKPSGRVILAAGASSVVVTNSLVTASSHVFVTRRTNDATALFSYLTSTGGSFTIFATAAATADTQFDFLVIGAN